jgi:phage terminase small subunit
MTPKQEQFVREYLIDLNATQAAIRAGYSARTAGAVGAENLTKPEIKAAIEAARDERSQAARIDAAWVLKRPFRQARLTRPHNLIPARRAGAMGACRWVFGSGRVMAVGLGDHAICRLVGAGDVS